MEVLTKTNYCTRSEYTRLYAPFSHALLNTLRFYLCVSVRVCVTDVGVAVTNLRVVCKITKMVILMFLEIVKAAADWDTLGCRLREGCHCERLPSY